MWSWVWVMGMHAWGRLSMGVGVWGAWGVRVGGRSPMAMARGGASGVPIQRNLLNVYPNLELTKCKRSSFPDLEYPHNFNRFHKTRFPEKNKKTKKEVQLCRGM